MYLEGRGPATHEARAGRQAVNKESSRQTYGTRKCSGTKRKLIVWAGTQNLYVDTRLSTKCVLNRRKLHEQCEVSVHGVGFAAMKEDDTSVNMYQPLRLRVVLTLPLAHF